MKKTALLLVLLLLGDTSFSQKDLSYIGFYNVENLFDTINQPNNDEEFLPEGKNQWTAERYLKKLNMLNQTIDSMGKIVLLGLCEIENKGVIEDLNKASVTRKEYGIVHYDSPDLRGIDVAIIYDTKRLKVNDSGTLSFFLASGKKSLTRDILWAKFTYKKDTLFALINHWPSRVGGAEKSEPNRIKAANLAARFIDSVTIASPSSKIVFMGDLNDYPTDVAPKIIAERLNPMITKSSGKYGGSYNYRGDWDVLDHIMVSPNVSTGKIKIVENSGEIISKSFLMVEYKGDMVPKRNYAGPKYLEGYSDHLPVRVGVRLK